VSAVVSAAVALGPAELAEKPRRARVVGFLNPAGSTAKSTVAAALAQCAAAAGRSVLAVDTDPQANLTGWLGGTRDTAGITQAVRAAAANDPAAWPGVAAAEVLADRTRQVRRTIQSTPARVDLIGADPGVRSLVRGWADLRAETPELLLAETIAAVAGGYDLVVVDTKGDLGVLAEAALRACDQVVGVATPTVKALEGLGLLRAEAARIGAARLTAVIPVQIRPRNRGAAADDLYQLMREDYPALITQPVRGASNLDAAYAAGEPVTQFEPDSPVSADLRAVYAELVDREVLR
jgi:chromosome partitioning protein